MRRVTTHSEAETERIGKELASRLGADPVVLLEGDLGSGKTVLVRGLADALGIAREEIQSPTYTLIHEHEGSIGRLVHVDLYRLESDELEALGLDELLAGRGIKAIEWAERLADPASEGAEPWPGAVRIQIARLADGGREISILEPGSATS